jgi:hypothetical protein
MTATATTPKPAVLSYLAPAVRVELLEDELTSGPEAGVELDASVAADISKVQVTLENTGCSQYSITLSNWRTAADGRSTGGGPRDGAGPTADWPRYKYNDFATFRFGRRLRLSMRYWPDDHRSTGEATGRAHAWVPMIAGPITDMQFSFGDGAQLTLTGEDDLSRLKGKSEDRHEFTKPARSERQIVDEVLGFAKFPLRPVPPRVELPPFATRAGDGIAEGLQEENSYLDYLTKLAQRLDCEIFIAFKTLDVVKGPDGKAQPPEQEFHFEPARSRARHDHARGETVTLRRDQTLVDFTPTIKVADQATAVVTTGRHRDRARPERVREANEDPATLLADELQYDPGVGDARPTPGPLVRKAFFGDHENPIKMPNTPNTDPERARFLANTKLREKAREFMTVQATTVGLPRLRAGNYVEIRGMREPFDGYYYCTRAVHMFDNSGLRTVVTARRPGMPLPAALEGKLK